MMTITLQGSGLDASEFPTLREFIAHRTAAGAKSAKSIALDLGMSGAVLSRKLNPKQGDTQRFNVDDLEAWLASTGEAPAVIEYLAAKFLDTDAGRKARTLAKVEKLLSELMAMVASMKSEA